MIDVLNLALPYFGLIFLGFVCGRSQDIPDKGLAWMGFFILYLALPALFFRILAKTPFEQLNNVPFIVTTTLATCVVLGLSFGVAMALRRGTANSSIAALAGAYGNIGYMGPGLALATIGAEAAAPVALIFCFETLVFFSFVPVMMAVARPSGMTFGTLAADVARKIAFNPLIVATLLGVVSAASGLKPPVALDRLLEFLQSAAAPCALFVLGVTVALRPYTSVIWDPAVPLMVAIKLILHPLLMLVALTAFGPFDPRWVSAAVLMAALPPALNVFVLARQYESWIEPASGSVVLGTAVSVATLTTVMWLVQRGALLDLLPY